MNIQDIYEKWQPKNHDTRSLVDFWNSMVKSSGIKEKLSAEDDSLLGLMRQKGMIDKAYNVLDIGCGKGRYSTTLAKYCCGVTAIDISDKMLKCAQENAKKLGLENITFVLDDWENIDIHQKKWEQAFDLVFAHMTPAIQSARALQKLNDASRGWCLLSKPTRRKDKVLDEVRSLIGIEEKQESAEKDIMYAFCQLWLQGYNPQFEYHRQGWEICLTVDEACEVYINRLKTYRKITGIEQEKIRSHLRSIAVDGKVYEKVITTVTTMYWHKLNHVKEELV